LRCNDGSLYTGATVDLPRRVDAHRRRRGAKYTRGRLPVTLVAWWHPPTYAAAKSHEARFKRLRRAEKLAALDGSALFGCAIHRGRGDG
jgi:putative endonuclease